MTALIIEDETAAQEHLQHLLSAHPGTQVVACLSSIAASVTWLKQQPKPDLIFLDIQLSDGLAFSIFDQVTLTTPIIFTTAYQEYAIQAFQHHSLDYLLKPITEEALAKALQKYQSVQAYFQPNWEQLQAVAASLTQPTVQYKQRFLVKYRNALVPISTKEIAYFFRQELVYLMTHDGKKYPLDFTLEKLENTLDPQDFLRINRQYLVRKSSIRKIDTYPGGKLWLALLPPAPQEVIVSQEKASWVKDKIND